MNFTPLFLSECIIFSKRLRFVYFLTNLTSTIISSEKKKLKKRSISIHLHVIFPLFLVLCFILKNVANFSKNLVKMRNRKCRWIKCFKAPPENISPRSVAGDDTNLANVICYKLLLIPQFFRIVCTKVYTKSQIS